MNKKSIRTPAKKYSQVIDNLNAALVQSDITKVALAKMVGIEYVTLDKYLRKERNIKNEEVVKRVIAVTEILNSMIAVDMLPLPSVINARERTKVALLKIDEYLSK